MLGKASATWARSSSKCFRMWCCDSFTACTAIAAIIAYYHLYAILRNWSPFAWIAIDQIIMWIPKSIGHIHMHLFDLNMFILLRLGWRDRCCLYHFIAGVRARTAMRIHGSKYSCLCFSPLCFLTVTLLTHILALGLRACFILPHTLCTYIKRRVHKVTGYGFIYISFVVLRLIPLRISSTWMEYVQL